MDLCLSQIKPLVITAKEIERRRRQVPVAVVEKRAALCRLVDGVVDLAYQPIEIIVLESSG